MLPAKTIDKVGMTTMRAIMDRMKRQGVETHEDHAIEGYEVTELAVLAQRMNAALQDADELRDWQNRLNLLVEKLISRKIDA